MRALRCQQKLRLPRVRYSSTSSKATVGDDDFLARYDVEQIAQYLSKLGPFPAYSSVLNPQHFYQNEVLMKFSQQNPHPVSLRQLAGYGKTLSKQKIINSANFVRLELPIRLAMRIRDLQTLPFGVVNNHHLAQVYESYYNSFNEFRKMRQINNLDDNDKFCSKISNMLDDHLLNLLHLMLGALEVSAQNLVPPRELDRFMSTTLRSRMSRRLIIEQHLSLSEIYRTEPYAKKPADYIGEIFQSCVAVEHLNEVYDKIQNGMSDMMDKSLMPDLQIDGDIDTKFPFIVPHLHYLLGEILRNSLQATIDFHGTSTKTKLPPIQVTVINAKKQVLFRISDQGGGLPHNKVSELWSFGKSPEVARKSIANFHEIPGLSANLQKSQKNIDQEDFESNEVFLNQTSLVDINTKSKKSTLSNLIERPHQFHLGLGLPICKVYADYWHGDLSMDCLEGYGTDTCLTLSKLGYHSNIIQLDKA